VSKVMKNNGRCDRNVAADARSKADGHGSFLTHLKLGSRGSPCGFDKQVVEKVRRRVLLRDDSYTRECTRRLRRFFRTPVVFTRPPSAPHLMFRDALFPEQSRIERKGDPQLLRYVESMRLRVPLWTRALRTRLGNEMIRPGRASEQSSFFNILLGHSP
jgi:hypothetical protein